MRLKVLRPRRRETPVDCAELTVEPETTGLGVIAAVVADVVGCAGCAGCTPPAGGAGDAVGARGTDVVAVGAGGWAGVDLAAGGVAAGGGRAGAAAGGAAAAAGGGSLRFIGKISKTFLSLFVKRLANLSGVIGVYIPPVS